MEKKYLGIGAEKLVPRAPYSLEKTPGSFGSVQQLATIHFRKGKIFWSFSLPRNQQMVYFWGSAGEKQFTL